MIIKAAPERALDHVKGMNAGKLQQFFHFTRDASVLASAKGATCHLNFPKSGSQL